MIQIVLWRKFPKIKNIFIDIVKKSFGDVKLSWLFKNLAI